MAASGFTPISLYYSTTASAVPTSGNLANGELGLNIADMKLYAKNSAGTVTLLASNAGASGSVTSVSGTGTVNGLTLTGTVTTSGSLTLGGTLSLVSPPPIGSTTPNTGAFTTLSSTLAATFGQTGASGTTSQLLSLVGRNSDGYAQFNFLANNGSTNNAFLGATSAGLDIATGSVVRGAFSSTGLAVTGALSATGAITNTAGTANGVLYLDGSKNLTSGATLVFDSQDRLIVGAGSAAVGNRMEVVANTSSEAIAIRGRVSDGSGHISWHPNASFTLYAKIESNNTSVLNFYTGSTLRFQFGSAGQFGIGGATYGNAGEVLTSGGSGAAPTWAAAGGGGAGAFVAFGSTGGM